MTETPQHTLADEQPPTPPDSARGPFAGRRGALRRSVTDRKVAGVAGGLGRYLDIDPTVLRVVLVVLCFFGGAGFVAYGAAWALVPLEGREQGTIPLAPGTRNALLVAAGVVALCLLVGDGWGGIGFPWPVLVVGAVVLAVVVLRERDRDVPAAEATDPATEPFAPGQPPAPPWMPSGQVPPPSRPARSRRGPLLFGFTLALVALALGGLGLYDVAGGHVVPSAYPALALAVVGLMLVVGSVVGRAGGLVLLGLLAALALGVTSVVHAAGGLDQPSGERLRAVPLRAVDVPQSYEVSNGRVVVDLSRLRDPGALDGRTLDVRAGAGELVVVLPRRVRTDVGAEISGPGQIDLPGRTTGGIDSTAERTVGSGHGLFALDTHLFAGHIDVRNPR